MEKKTLTRIPIAEPLLDGNELKYLTECIKTSWISSQGKFIGEFENNFSKFCNRKYGVAVSNGTVALHLALAALGIKPGDEVIVPNLTFAATANCVLYMKAKPVLVDIESQTWNIDPVKIKEKITEKTKAIIPVHIYGHPCDIDPILEIAEKHNLFVVEDAAEAHGAEYKGKKVGSFGDISCFSFFGNKIITTGEGGMCITEDEKLDETMRILRDHGMSKQKKYWHDRLGFNYRMTNLQAAVGVAQLERADEFIKKKIWIAETYTKFLKDFRGITLAPKMPWAKNVYWMYSILIEDEFGVSRDDVINKLKEKEIETRPFFYPLSEMPFYNDGNEYPVSKEISRKGINLPSFVSITEEKIKYVCDQIKLLK